jgi:hypothetical protein
MTRYDMMHQSKVRDIDGDFFPDPLSITFDKPIKQLPTAKQIGGADISKFWMTYYEQYEETDGDDLLLSRNQIPYIGKLKPGDIIYFFQKDDLADVVFEEKG